MLYSPQADAAIFAATKHRYQHEHERFVHEGMAPMSPVERDQFVDNAIMRYLVNHDDSKGQRIMAFTTSADIAQPDRQTLAVFADELYYDEFWRMAFRPIPLAQGEREWEIHDAHNPIEMDQIEEGGQVRTQQVSSDKTTYKTNRYGVSVGYSEEMLNANRLAPFITSIETMRTSYMRAIANSHYAVLAAASTTGSGSQIGAQGQSSQSLLVRDIATINAGLAKIEQDLKNIAPEALGGRYILYVSGIGMLGRMRAAIAATLNSLTIEREAGASSATVQRQVEPVSSLNDNVPAGKGILVLAGRKIQSADAGLRSYQVVDAKSENLERMLWSNWRAVAADSRQAVELTFA